MSDDDWLVLPGTDRTPVSIGRVVTSPATIGTFVLLVVPFALGWLKSALFSPLALPSYVLYGIGTAIGDAIAPRFDFWLYWIPFLASCVGISVTIGFGYEWWRERADDDSSERL
ncbi:hypothetical protein [Natronorubrum halophilum]|uniref:hypothetical protein n=1 Tax=Natronorubrum halophilum TaxID=1702106 RepID=UPI000EF74C37|nr:hypothetical protein [Natronorubrum halophilum]